MAEIIDAQILENYVLSDSNFFALEKLKEDGLAPLHLLGDVLERREISKANRRKFKKRIKAVDPNLYKHLLLGYANPVINKLKSGFLV